MTSPPDPDSVAIGSAVRGAIAQAGLSHTEVAEAIDMSLATLSRRVNGALPFTWPEIIAICAIVDTPVEEVVAAAVRRASRGKAPAA